MPAIYHAFNEQNVINVINCVFYLYYRDKHYENKNVYIKKIIMMWATKLFIYHSKAEQQKDRSCCAAALSWPWLSGTSFQMALRRRVDLLDERGQRRSSLLSWSFFECTMSQGRGVYSLLFSLLCLWHFAVWLCPHTSHCHTRLL